MRPLDFTKRIRFFIFVATKQFFSKRTSQAFASSVGFFWLFVQIWDYFFDLPKWLQGYIVWFCLICCIAYTLWKIKPITLLSYEIAGMDIDIVIQITDIFSIQETTYVISTNTSFDFAVNKNLISPKSLQGIFLSRFYKNNYKLFNKQLNEILKNEKVVSERTSEVGGQPKLYQLGTVVKIATKNKNTTYFVAISELNQHGNAQSSFENIKITLPSLWNYIGL